MDGWAWDFWWAHINLKEERGKNHLCLCGVGVGVGVGFGVDICYTDIRYTASAGGKVEGLCGVNFLHFMGGKLYTQSH